MPTQTEMREAVVTAVDTYTKLTGGGDGTTLQDISVPEWAHSIKHVAVCAGIDGAAGQGVILVSLRVGTTHGDQILAMGGHSNIGTTVAIAGEKLQRDVDIGVTPGKSLEIWGCLAGGDTGSPELGVSITFSEKAGTHAYVTRQGAPGTADVWATLNTENGLTTVNDHLTQGQKMDQVWIVASYGATTQEPLAVYARVQGVGGSIAGNEHTFCGPSYMVSDGALADACIFEAMVYDVDIKCKPGTVRLQAVSSGGTITIDPEVAITVVYQV